MKSQQQRFALFAQQEHDIIRRFDGPEPLSPEWHKVQLNEELELLNSIPSRQALTRERIAWHRSELL